MQVNVTVFYKLLLPYLQGMARHVQIANQIAEFVEGQCLKKDLIDCFDILDSLFGQISSTKVSVRNTMAIFSFFFCLRREIPFLGKFGPKNKNCQFRQKFDA